MLNEQAIWLSASSRIIATKKKTVSNVVINWKKKIQIDSVRRTSSCKLGLRFSYVFFNNAFLNSCLSLHYCVDGFSESRQIAVGGESESHFVWQHHIWYEQNDQGHSGPTGRQCRCTIDFLNFFFETILYWL